MYRVRIKQSTGLGSTDLLVCDNILHCVSDLFLHDVYLDKRYKVQLLSSKTTESVIDTLLSKGYADLSAFRCTEE